MSEQNEPRNGNDTESDGITAVLRNVTTTVAKRELISRRDGFADALDIPLTEAERKVLRAIPENQLEQMLGSFPGERPGGAGPVERNEMLLLGGMGVDMPPPRDFVITRRANRLLWLILIAVALLAMGALLLAKLA